MKHASRRRASGCRTYLLGRHRNGGWVVRDPAGRSGGLFTSRAAALHFALWEQREPCAVVETADIIEGLI